MQDGGAAGNRTRVIAITYCKDIDRLRAINAGSLARSLHLVPSGLH